MFQSYGSSLLLGPTICPPGSAGAGALMNYRHVGRSSQLPQGVSAASASHAQPIISPEEREMLRADATRVQSSRELRRKLFDPHIFGEYGWDILLALYVSETIRGRLNTTELC